MIEIIFFYFSTILVLVISNPVPQTISVQTCPYQQNGYYNQPITIPVILQQPTRKNNPSYQQITTQNQMQQQENPLNENINQNLVNQILSNPSLQKILDPNTKLYNQNGIEIKRHNVLNTGVVPNVINNYFIVPPEFLNLNDTYLKKDVSQNMKIVKPQNKRVAKANINRKDAQINTNKRQLPIEISNTVTSGNTVRRIEDDNGTIDQKQTKTEKQKGNREKNYIQSISDSEIDNNCTKDGESSKPQRIKPKRKNEKQNINEVSSEAVGEKISRKRKEEPIAEGNRDQNTNERKRRRKVRPKTSKQNEYYKLESSIENIEDNVPCKMENKTLELAQYKQEKNNHVKDIEVPEIINNDRSQLRDIENPIESLHQEDNPLENRLVRNPKSENVAKDLPRNYAGSPNDMYRSFFPYMPYYPNGIFPFSYDQFFQSLQFPNPGIGERDNTRRRKQKKNRKNQQQTKNSSSNLNCERNTSPNADKKASNMTTDTPTVLIQTNIVDNKTQEKPQPIEQVIEIPMEVPHKVSPTHVDEHSEIVEVFDDKSRLKKQEYKTNDYVIPELGTEDVLPTIHRNGIINDYYPVFNNDDVYLSSDEDYYIQNLDSDRYFYTTDRNLDAELNRDRRKHKSPSEDIQRNPKYNRNRDRYSYNTERDDSRHRYREYEEPNTQKPRRLDNIQSKTRRPIYESEEVQFRTPPVLEFPDFRTKKVQKEFDQPETHNYDEIERFVDDFVDKSSSYSNVKTLQYNTRVKPNADVKRVRITSKNTKPKSNNVETVFARSKVAKYGQVLDDSEEQSSTPLTYYEDEPQYYSDSDTTYVLAKSLYQDDYW